MWIELSLGYIVLLRYLYFFSKKKKKRHIQYMSDWNCNIYYSIRAPLFLSKQTQRQQKSLCPSDFEWLLLVQSGSELLLLPLLSLERCLLPAVCKWDNLPVQWYVQHPGVTKTKATLWLSYLSLPLWDIQWKHLELVAGNNIIIRLI